MSGWKVARRKPSLPLVGLAADKVIHDRWNSSSLPYANAPLLEVYGS
ncbi:MAG: hypothetical protein ACQESR_20290 [Planctomycetota bacterium]